jgi:hypothetical protein
MKKTKMAVKTGWIGLVVGVMLIGQTQAGSLGAPFKVIDSSTYFSFDSNFQYSYCPSIVYENGVYHCWFGSTPDAYSATTNPVRGLDAIRYSTSTDGTTWSVPTRVLKISPNEGSTSDPGTVYFNGYWYIYYTNNLRINGNGNVISVARSASPGGPFVKYTTTNTWVADPAAVGSGTGVKALVTPFLSSDTIYGAGQASVVNFKGKLYMWYTDNSNADPGVDVSVIYMKTSTDGVTWSAAVSCNLRMSTIDVKFDQAKGVFVLHNSKGGHEATVSMDRYYSRDGVNWTSAFDSGSLPAWSHNPGISGDKCGNICLNNDSLFAYAAPFDLSSSYQQGPWQTPIVPTAKPYTWGFWDLYANRIKDAVRVAGDFDGDGIADAAMVDAATGKWYIRSSKTGSYGVPSAGWGWQWPGMSSRFVIACADYNGDGKTDLAIVDTEAVGGSKWYVINGATGMTGNDACGIPWGDVWTGTTGFKVVVADYDGDGKADRAMVDMNATGGAKWYIKSSLSGGNGVSNVSWGYQWTGMSGTNELVVGDYDGDGKADPAIIDRHASGGIKWYIKYSTGTGRFTWGYQWPGSDASFTVINTLTGGTKCDFDGDGKTDIGIVSPKGTDTGCKWYVNCSTTGAIPWGYVWSGMDDSSAIALGDFDGDRKTDRTIYNPSGSNYAWYVIYSNVIPTNGITWGMPFNTY